MQLMRTPRLSTLITRVLRLVGSDEAIAGVAGLRAEADERQEAITRQVAGAVPGTVEPRRPCRRPRNTTRAPEIGRRTASDGPKRKGLPHRGEGRVARPTKRVIHEARLSMRVRGPSGQETTPATVATVQAMEAEITDPRPARGRAPTADIVREGPFGGPSPDTERAPRVLLARVVMDKATEKHMRARTASAGTTAIEGDAPPDPALETPVPRPVRVQPAPSAIPPCAPPTLVRPRVGVSRHPATRSMKPPSGEA